MRVSHFALFFALFALAIAEPVIDDTEEEIEAAVEHFTDLGKQTSARLQSCVQTFNQLLKQEQEESQNRQGSLRTLRVIRVLLRKLRGGKKAANLSKKEKDEVDLMLSQLEVNKNLKYKNNVTRRSILQLLGSLEARLVSSERAFHRKIAKTLRRCSKLCVRNQANQRQLIAKRRLLVLKLQARRNELGLVLSRVRGQSRVLHSYLFDSNPHVDVLSEDEIALIKSLLAKLDELESAGSPADVEAIEDEMVEIGQAVAESAKGSADMDLLLAQFTTSPLDISKIREILVHMLSEETTSTEQTQTVIAARKKRLGRLSKREARLQKAHARFVRRAKTEKAKLRLSRRRLDRADTLCGSLPTSLAGIKGLKLRLRRFKAFSKTSRGVRPTKFSSKVFKRCLARCDNRVASVWKFRVAQARKASKQCRAAMEEPNCSVRKFLKKGTLGSASLDCKSLCSKFMSMKKLSKKKISELRSKLAKEVAAGTSSTVALAKKTAPAALAKALNPAGKK